MILRDSVRKGEKNQKRISSGSSPIYVLQAELLFEDAHGLFGRSTEVVAGLRIGSEHIIFIFEKM